STLTRLYCRLPPPVPQLPVDPVVETQPIEVRTVYGIPSTVVVVVRDSTLKASGWDCAQSISAAARLEAVSRATDSAVRRWMDSSEYAIPIATIEKIISATR